VLDETLPVHEHLAKEDGLLARDMIFLEHWMKRPSIGVVRLFGGDSDVHEKPDFLELIAINRHQTHSLATRVVEDFWVRFWYRCYGKRAKVRAWTSR